MTARYVADEAALREALYGLLAWEPGQNETLDSHSGCIAAALLASGVVQPRKDAVREAKAEALREAADTIRLDDHTCFKSWCPHCAIRKEREHIRADLTGARAILAVLADDDPAQAVLAALARVEALADQWEREDTCGCTGCYTCTRADHDLPKLRAALALAPGHEGGK